MGVFAGAAARPHASGKRAPDFFIVGHPKSGTTAMFRMLAEHPQLHMPRKEPSYFVPELRSRLMKRSSLHVTDEMEYLSLFDEARPDQLIGEATPAYLWSPTAAARIAELQPDARIIAVLREPASFLRSLHLQFILSNVETERDLRSAIALEEERRHGRRIPPNSTRPQQLVYSDHVRYVEQLRRYEDVFGAERMLVLIYEDFRADNEEALRQVLRFLGVDLTSSVPLIEINHSAALRSPRLHDAIRSLYLGRAPAARAAKQLVKALTSQRLRHGTIRTTRRLQRTQPPRADEELMLELRRRFRGEVEALSAYLGRDMIARWGYERLD